MHQKKGQGAVKHTGAALDLYHSADSRTWEGRGSREDVMLFTAQQVIIWSPGITWFCNQAFIFEWHCVKAITPIWQSNKKMDSDWKLICLIDLKRKKIATFFFCAVKKKMVNWDDIFTFRHKAQVCGEGTPVPSDLADSAIWLIELLSETFIHIIRNIRKVYRCKFSNYCLALCILMRVEHTRYSERLTWTDLP